MDSLVVVWILVAVGILGIVAYMFKMAANRRVEESPARSSDLRASKSEPTHHGSVPDRRTPECEAIRQKLRLPLMYDEEKIDRLIAMERSLTPSASEKQLHAAAYERWVRDNH